MQLTLFTDYSLRVLIFLALHSGRSVPSAEIASSFGISRNHLLKVVRALVEQGLVDSTRGAGGGLRLARPASEIRIGQLVRRMEPATPLLECFDLKTNQCRIVPACTLKRVLARALAAFHAELDQHTLGDLVHQRGELLELLQPAPSRARARKTGSGRYPAGSRALGTARRTTP
jgi:Rrf2 family nitric oxide-sensitive transcriptional repressor